MNSKNLSKYIIILAIALMAAGAITIYGSTQSMNLFKSHMGKIILSVAAFGVFSLIPYEYYRKYSKYALFAVVALLLITPVFGVTRNGGTRWLNFWFITFQPSELAKVVLLMHLAVLIEKKGELLKSFSKGFKFALIWIFLVAGLVIIQPNVSTSMIIVMLSFTVLYVGGAKFKHIMATVLIVLVLVTTAVYTIYPHAKKRIADFGAKDHYQVHQAKIALGSGGTTGLGLGNSRQSEKYIPFHYSDFIFSIIGEENGLVGVSFLLSAYVAIFGFGFLIAKKAKDKFAQLFAFGISFLILLSAFIHISVVTGLMPNTGVTLPFVSYGGTSLIVFSMCLGILTNIAYKNRTVEEIRVETFG